MAKQQKYYVIWKGLRPGIYTTWAEAEAQIKGFTGAAYKSFATRAEAETALAQGAPTRQFSAKPAGAGKTSAGPGGKIPRSAIRWNSISVDAACSGNPGPMEYQGVKTQGGERIFHQAFALGTNNIGEFLAIVHGLALLKQQNLPDLPIYTDSATALAWVRNKKVKTTLPRTAQTETLWQLIDRGEQWLKQNTWKNPLLKWETDSWGEIPADFGRKG